MMPIPNRDAVALSARTLGALFSYAPNSAENAPLVAAFQDGSWQQQWPFPVAAPLASGFAASAEETLPEAWQRLFIGPWALPAPPWGSVWLDKESVLFGDSTLALRQWMRENGIALEADGNEPEDHFGTVLLLAAWLCETEQDALFAQLLAWHLLPWSGRFLSVFVDHAAHPFYQALGQLAQATLAQWQENLPIAVAQKPLYRYPFAAPVSGAVLFCRFPAFHPHLSLLHLRLFPITISQCFLNLAVTNASSSSLS